MRGRARSFERGRGVGRGGLDPGHHELVVDAAGEEVLPELLHGPLRGARSVTAAAAQGRGCGAGNRAGRRASAWAAMSGQRGRGWGVLGQGSTATGACGRANS